MKYTLTDFSNILKFLKNEDIKISFHCKIRIADRGINIEDIFDKLLNFELVGIIYQEEGRYELIYEFDSIFDLSIIVVYERKCLKIITVIKKLVMRRVKD